MATTNLAVVCVPAADGVAVAPCGVWNGQPTAPGVVETPTLTASTVAAVEQAALPLDYKEAGAFWAASFGIVVVLFVLGHSIGSIIGMFRD